MNQFPERLNLFGRWLAAHLGPMSLDLLVFALVVYAVIRLLRIKSPTVRHLFWALVLLKPLASMLVVSPVSLYALLPKRPAAAIVQPAQTAMPGPPSAPPALHSVPLANVPAASGAKPLMPAPLAPPAAPALDGFGMLAMGWLTISFALLLKLLIGIGYVFCLKRTANLQTTGALAEISVETSRVLGMHERVRIALSDHLSGPVLAGILWPVILFPAVLIKNMTREQLRLLVAHELAHARRGDNAWLLLQRLAESLLFFHPAVWICGGMMRREAEFACDNAVLTTFDGSVEYADSLTRMAELSVAPASRLLSNTATAAESNLAVRVRRVLKGHAVKTTVGLGTLWAITLVVVGCLGLPRGGREQTATSGDKEWTTILNVNFDNQPPPYSVQKADPGVVWSIVDGQGRFSGATTDSAWDEDWAEFSVDRDGRTRTEVACDFRVAACTGYHRIVLAAVTSSGNMRMYYEGGSGAGVYGIDSGFLGVGSTVIKGADTMPGFGDETNAFHSLRIVHDRAALTVDYYVDDQLLGTMRMDRALRPVKDVRLEFVSGDHGYPVDIRYDNLRVRTFGPVRDKAVAYDPSADRVLSDAEAAEVRSEAGERLYLGAQTTQGVNVVEVYYGVDSQRPFKGVAIKKHINGRIERKCEFRDGLANGIRQEWYPTGAKLAVTSLENGVRHGREKRWHANGQLSLDGSYWHGWRDGLFVQWYETGQMRFKGFFRGKLQEQLIAEWQQKPFWAEYGWFFRCGIPEGVMTYWNDIGQTGFTCETDSDYRLLRMSGWTPDDQESRADSELPDVEKSALVESDAPQTAAVEQEESVQIQKIEKLLSTLGGADSFWVDGNTTNAALDQKLLDATAVVARQQPLWPFITSVCEIASSSSVAGQFVGVFTSDAVDAQALQAALGSPTHRTSGYYMPRFQEGNISYGPMIAYANQSNAVTHVGTPIPGSPLEWQGYDWIDFGVASGKVVVVRVQIRPLLNALTESSQSP